MGGSEASEGPSFTGWGIPCVRLKSVQGVLVEIDKLVPERVRKCRGPRRAETVLKTLNNFGGHCGRRASGLDACRWTRLCGVSRRAMDGAAQGRRRCGLCGPGSVRYAQGSSCEPRPRRVPNSAGQHVQETPRNAREEFSL